MPTLLDRAIRDEYIAASLKLVRLLAERFEHLPIRDEYIAASLKRYREWRACWRCCTYPR